MKNEFNRTASEWKASAREFSTAEEIKSFAGNADVRETGSTAEYPAGSPAAPKHDGGDENRRQEQARNISKSVGNAASGLASVATVAVVAVVAVTGASVNVSAEIVSLTVTDTVLCCTVNLDSDTDASLVVYNDFTRREETLENGENVVEVTGLKADVQYTVAVVYAGSFGETTLIEESVRTDKYPPLVTVLYSVESECTCNVDGYFHFTLDFIDENGYWTDFEAWLEDAYGNRSYCEFTQNLLEEQSIDVIWAGLRGNSAAFTVACTSSDPDAEEETLVLYSATVLI